MKYYFCQLGGVIYAEDESLLNSQFSCFFNDQRHWPINAYIRMEMTVCGILKEPTEQYYFSEKLCKVLSNNMRDEKVMYAFGTKNNDTIVSSGYKSIIPYVDDCYE